MGGVIVEGMNREIFFDRAVEKAWEREGTGPGEKIS